MHIYVHFFKHFLDDVTQLFYHSSLKYTFSYCIEFALIYDGEKPFACQLLCIDEFQISDPYICVKDIFFFS